jgi:hypothetical protein
VVKELWDVVNGKQLRHADRTEWEAYQKHKEVLAIIGCQSQMKPFCECKIWGDYEMYHAW